MVIFVLICRIRNDVVRTKYNYSGVDAPRLGRIFGINAGDRQRQREIFEQRERKYKKKINTHTPVLKNF